MVSLVCVKPNTFSPTWSIFHNCVFFLIYASSDFHEISAFAKNHHGYNPGIVSLHDSVDPVNRPACAETCCKLIQVRWFGLKGVSSFVLKTWSMFWLHVVSSQDLGSRWRIKCTKDGFADLSSLELPVSYAFCCLGIGSLFHKLALTRKEVNVARFGSSIDSGRRSSKIGQYYCYTQRVPKTASLFHQLALVRKDK